MKNERELCWTRRRLDLNFGTQSLRAMMRKTTNHEVCKEFMASINSDVSVEELGMAQLTLEPKQAIFVKPEDGKDNT
jgi:hypothetical protein